jgi:hypothetical protein
VPLLWPNIFKTGHEIAFARTSFKWANLASHKAGVTVAIVGISNQTGKTRRLFSIADDGSVLSKEAGHINAYLVPASNLIVEATSTPINGLAAMMFGNMPRDGGHLLLSVEERKDIICSHPNSSRYLKDFVGSEDAIYGRRRVCIWVGADEYHSASQVPALESRFLAVRREREWMKAASTQSYAEKPYRFVQIQGVAEQYSFLVPRHSSESRPYLPVAMYNAETIVADSALAIYDALHCNLALLASRLHLVWIATVCGKLKTDFRYSNTLGWNTFPVPTLTDKNKADLTGCAEDILLAREAHFPATIADLYDPENMPGDLRQAHERNDEVLERIYIGRRFRNDTERLEKLFDMYTKMTAASAIRA